MTTPTPEQYLAQTEADDEDVDEEPRQNPDPLESIADSLRRVTALLERRDAEDVADDQLQTEYDKLDQAYGELEGRADAKQALIDQVLEICKPSTSKLADRVRAVVNEADSPSSATPEEPDHPAHDAPVEEWREFARGRGYTGDDIDRANRSQLGAGEEAAAS